MKCVLPNTTLKKHNSTIPAAIPVSILVSVAEHCSFGNQNSFAGDKINDLFNSKSKGSSSADGTQLYAALQGGGYVNIYSVCAMV